MFRRSLIPFARQAVASQSQRFGPVRLGSGLLHAPAAAGQRMAGPSFSSLAAQAEAEEADESGYKGLLEGGFSAGDLNQDGSLDRNEFQLLVRNMGMGWDHVHMLKVFASIDKNKDGRIEPHEWHEALMKSLEAPPVTHASAAEAEEAEMTGFTDFVESQKTLVQKLETFLNQQ
eukprot:TRINITY_DN13934_c0_g1_i1.p1 TRINITY_DN13934_c0_g1~~TRINITY_DN13934_c0_g1_i1.p1  ORF type:complete len:195 (+),score=56.32 TRINITY_DN13934_c0_g1_i1:64-585(+)